MKRKVVPRRFGDSGRMFHPFHYDRIAACLVKAHQRTGFGLSAALERKGVELVRQELIEMFLRDDPAFDVQHFCDLIQPLIDALSRDEKMAQKEIQENA